MLDYYDRCYDHELNRRDSPVLTSVDLAGIDADAAAKRLQQEAAVRGVATAVRSGSGS
jgi:hypothetical protein